MAPGLNQAADGADVVDSADADGADEHVAVEAESLVVEVFGVDALRRIAAFAALPQAEGVREQADGIEHVHRETAAVRHVLASHVEGGRATMFGGGRLQRVNDPFARREVAALGYVAGGVDARHRGLHAVVDDDALVDLGAGAFEEGDVRSYARGEDDQVGIEALSVHHSRADPVRCARCAPS